MRKGFKFIDPADVLTHVYDNVSMTIPDQSLSLRDMLMQFAYISGEKLSEIVNRGYDGDEDDDILGMDVGALDFAEVHDRMLDMALSAHQPEPKVEPEPEVEPEPKVEPEPQEEPEG